MKIKRNLIIFLFIFFFVMFSTINFKNTNKISLRLLNTKIERLSLGNLIILSFLSGFSITTFAIHLSNYDKKRLIFNYEYDDIDLNSTEYKNTEENLSRVRPPERDIRDSQPTISVNYRFIDQNTNSNQKDTNNFKKDMNDWTNDETDWE